MPRCWVERLRRQIEPLNLRVLPAPQTLRTVGLLAILLLFSSGARAEIVVDGVMDEAEWGRAQQLEALRGVMPKLGDAAPWPTEVRLISRPDGLYIGIANFQPYDTHVDKLHPRDGWSFADFNQVVIDFAASGVQAYEFFVSLGGSIKDGTWRNQNERSTDWDGLWHAATSRHPDRWEMEMLIPWGSVALPAADSDMREIRLYVSRRVLHTNRMYGAPFLNMRDQKFISEFTPIQIRAYSARQLIFTPYASADSDQLPGGEDERRAGVDINWRYGPGQISATLNPDFGTAESDDLVVNFSSVETLLSDRRPFFTENQDLFKITGHRLTLINTRRIGSEPDYRCGDYDDEPSKRNACEAEDDANQTLAELDFGIKLNHLLNNREVGLLVASEGDSRYSEGRDFFALRGVINRSPNKIGALVTHTRRPVIERDARVYSLDYEYVFNSKWRITGLSMQSSVQEADADPVEGFGQRLIFWHTPDDEWQNFYVLAHYDEGFDLNDMGYVNRDEYNDFYISTKRIQRQFDKDSPLRRRQFEFNVDHSRGYDNLNLRRFVELKLNGQFKNSYQLNFSLVHRDAGIDDLMTFSDPAGPYARVGESGELEIFAKTPDQRRVFFEVAALAGREPLGGRVQRLRARVHFKLSLTSNLSLQLIERRSSGWLVSWHGDRFITRFSDTLRNRININFDWLPAPGHEIRLKVQWAGIQAHSGQLLTPDLSDGGELRPAQADLDGSLTNRDSLVNGLSYYSVSSQLRYRWRFAPLSDFYLVYQRGGSGSENAETGDPEFSRRGLIRTAWSHPDQAFLLAKLSYRF
ncbi:MAG: hypothetical protein ISN29_04030 [Gammaproteobacteria bacterium AqS3]|nr:hypothetical protein [Gammaproteobacteria bacterium AqS3]